MDIKDKIPLMFLTLDQVNQFLLQHENTQSGNHHSAAECNNLQFCRYHQHYLSSRTSYKYRPPHSMEECRNVDTCKIHGPVSGNGVDSSHNDRTKSRKPHSVEECRNVKFCRIHAPKQGDSSNNSMKGKSPYLKNRKAVHFHYQRKIQKEHSPADSKKQEQQSSNKLTSYKASALTNRLSQSEEMDITDPAMESSKQELSSKETGSGVVNKA